jgi:hypothetical protein
VFVLSRVAATFNTYATYGDATSLFQRLKTVRVVEVSDISSELKIIQNEKEIRSAPQPTAAHVSDDDLDFTIYVSKEKKAKLISVLPKNLEKWLRQDRYPWHTFEVVSSLTSIIASDISVLDEILEDQGIIELSFQNQDLDDTKKSSEGKSECASSLKIAVRLPEEEQTQSLVLRGRESAAEVADKDASV